MWMYYWHNEVSRCRRSIRRVCRLQTSDNSAAISVSRTRSSSSAARNVLAALFQFRKLLPSGVNASKLRGWRCNYNLGLVSVEIETRLCFMWKDVIQYLKSKCRKNVPATCCAILQELRKSASAALRYKPVRNCADLKVV